MMITHNFAEIRCFEGRVGGIVTCKMLLLLPYVLRTINNQMMIQTVVLQYYVLYTIVVNFSGIFNCTGR